MDQAQLQRDNSGGYGSLALAKDWAVLTIAAATVIALAGIVVAAMTFVISERRQITAVRSRVEERLTNVDRELASLSAGMGRLVASNAAASPDFPRRLLEQLNESLRHASENDNPILAMKTAAAITRKARELGIDVNPQEVAAVGQGFLRLVDDGSQPTNPQLAGPANDRLSVPAIETAGELIGYRSVLLQRPFPPQNELLAQSAMLKLPKLHPFTPLGSTSKIYGSRSMAVTSAKIDLLDRPEPILSEDYRALLVDGYDVKIDGMDIRNVVFRSSKIAYAGGRLSLNNVFFSNCTFQIAPEGKGFANVALGSASGQMEFVKQ
jgi:hypothetical protein